MSGHLPLLDQRTGGTLETSVSTHVLNPSRSLFHVCFSGFDVGWQRPSLTPEHWGSGTPRTSLSKATRADACCSLLAQEPSEKHMETERTGGLSHSLSLTQAPAPGIWVSQTPSSRWPVSLGAAAPTDVMKGAEIGPTQQQPSPFPSH